jgi:polyferredoxin
VFLDVARRRFHLFGLTLAAQDLWLLFFLISGAWLRAVLRHGAPRAHLVRLGLPPDRLP